MVDGMIAGMRERYITALIDRAMGDTDPALLDRIEHLLGLDQPSAPAPQRLLPSPAAVTTPPDAPVPYNAPPPAPVSAPVLDAVERTNARADQIIAARTGAPRRGHIGRHKYRNGACVTPGCGVSDPSVSGVAVPHPDDEQPPAAPPDTDMLCPRIGCRGSLVHRPADVDGLFRCTDCNTATIA